jgi:hypothetical protein
LLQLGLHELAWIVATDDAVERIQDYLGVLPDPGGEEESPERRGLAMGDA